MAKKKVIDETELLVNKIVEGIQEKKGLKITVVDMSKFDDYVFRYFVICQGNSNTHVTSIADEVREYVREQIHVKPFAMDGYTNSQWIAVDYGGDPSRIFTRVEGILQPRNPLGRRGHKGDS